MNNKFAATGGGTGDIIYAIPTLRKLEVAVIYIKESFYPDGSSMYSILKTFMESQGFRVLPTSGAFPHYEYEPGLYFDYDLDACKKDPHNRGVIHIMESFDKFYKLPYRGDTMFLPWINGIEPRDVKSSNYTTWMITERWREYCTTEWSDIWKSVEGDKVFIGIEADYKYFCDLIGDNKVTWIVTRDVLAVARLIRSGRAHYCNQNFSLPLALGMGCEHYVELKARKTNCMSTMACEHILNPQDL